MSSGSSGVSNASTASASKFQLLSATKNQNTQDTTDSITIEPIRNEGGEPIYAVVNLKDKYEHRAKKKTLDEQLFDSNCIPRRERPNSFHVVSADYEEVRTFSVYLFFRSLNIYAIIYSCFRLGTTTVSGLCRRM